MPVNIHGKQYVTVAERLVMARKEIKSIKTDLIPHNEFIIVKATVVTDKGSFDGMSAANTSKSIEKASPVEVAETSAVGRALGFAGYGAVEGIATADEVVKAGAVEKDPTDDWGKEGLMLKCKTCGDELTAKEMTFYTSYQERRGLPPTCYQCSLKAKGESK